MWQSGYRTDLFIPGLMTCYLDEFESARKCFHWTKISAGIYMYNIKVVLILIQNEIG